MRAVFDQFFAGAVDDYLIAAPGDVASMHRAVKLGQVGSALVARRASGLACVPDRCRGDKARVAAEAGDQRRAATDRGDHHTRSRLIGEQRGHEPML